MVTFLANLSDLEHSFSAHEPRTGRQVGKIDARDKQVFPERAVGHARAARVEFLDLIIA